MSTDAPGYDPALDLQQHAATARTTHPEAQWFPQAGLGLFMHWGIHSVEGLQPSWAMVRNYPYGGDNPYNDPQRYWSLAERFDPQAYDPDEWMAAAAAAGFTYAVLTAKHHDGYALWPSRYGDFGTRQYLAGRDLLQPYVDACRRHGLRVGFYFSPTDWHYPGYPPAYADHDYSHGPHRTPPLADPVANQEACDRFLAYTRGQCEELLTRYGRLDLLWFDGVGWPGATLPEGEMFAWLRSLQPHLVINNRWPGGGDFETPECHLPSGRPADWWEACAIWNGHWGYNPGRACLPNTWVLENLVTCRAWGGNFLLNCGPAPDGTMPADFYHRCTELAAWMQHSRESLFGAQPTPGDDRASVPLTQRDGTWYLHVLPRHDGPVTVRHAAEPQAATHLRTGAPVAWRREGEVLIFDRPPADEGSLDEVVAVKWG